MIGGVSAGTFESRTALIARLGEYKRSRAGQPARHDRGGRQAAPEDRFPQAKANAMYRDVSKPTKAKQRSRVSVLIRVGDDDDL